MYFQCTILYFQFITMNNSKKVLITTALALGVLTFGVMSVSAQDGEGNGIFTRVSEILNVSEDDLDGAFIQAKTEHIDQKVADGDLTEEEATAIKEKIASGEFHFGDKKGKKGERYEKMRETHQAVAEFIGIDEEAMKEALMSGQTLAEVAENNGKSKVELVDFLTDYITGQIIDAVEEEKIDQDKADEMLAKLSEKVSEMVDKVRDHDGDRPGASRDSVGS